MPITRPKPRQVSQAPIGELNENRPATVPGSGCRSRGSAGRRKAPRGLRCRRSLAAGASDNVDAAAGRRAAPLRAPRRRARAPRCPRAGGPARPRAVAAARMDARVALLLEQREDFGLGEVLGHVTGNVTPGADRRRCALAAAFGVDRLRRVAPHARRSRGSTASAARAYSSFRWSVELGHRAHRRARRAHRVGLVDRDRRRNAVDAIDLRLVHAVEELPRVRRERLDVAALTFGVQGVEDQRGLARPETPVTTISSRRQLERQVLQVVLAGAVDRDGVGHEGSEKRWSRRHGATARRIAIVASARARRRACTRVTTGMRAATKSGAAKSIA